jgi:hypothetical protein
MHCGFITYSPDHALLREEFLAMLIASQCPHPSYTKKVKKPVSNMSRNYKYKLYIFPTSMEGPLLNKFVVFGNSVIILSVIF